MVRISVVIIVVLALALMIVRYFGDDSAPRENDSVSRAAESSPNQQLPGSEALVDEKAVETAALSNNSSISSVQVGPASDQTDGARQEFASDTIKSRYAVISTENFNRFFYSDAEEATTAMLQAAEEQEYDIEWSSLAMDVVNDSLEKAGTRSHSATWTVDCHTTICVVEFPDSALDGYDTRPTIKMLEGGIFERAVWYRRYKDDFAYLFVVLPEFSYDRDRN